MRIDAGAQFDRRIHSEPPRRFDLTAIIADVLAAAIRIFSDVMAGGEIRRVVKAGRGNRDRQAVEPGTGNFERVANDANVLARRCRDDPRFDWRRQRVDPGRADFVERAAKTDAIDVRIGGKPRDQNGDIVTRAFAIGRVREQEGPPVALRYAAAILPADQGMHFGIFVDRLVDDEE
jgi:hypothetical protein